MSAQHLTSSKGNATYQTNTILSDPIFQLAAIIDQTSLLTSLLQVYARSPDQAGLREDIAMLASIQSQHLADWLNFEKGQALAKWLGAQCCRCLCRNESFDTSRSGRE